MYGKRARIEKRNYFILFLILFGLIFVRYCYYGFNYYYQLDDYIQYNNYVKYGGGFKQLVTGTGLLSSRPLAGILDFFVWSRFYGQMLAAVALISAMYAGSGILLHSVFSKQFGTGSLFFAVYTLLPLGFEGTYWLSASSRIVVGLFLASLAFFFFDLWCGEGRKRDLVLFAVLQFAAFCLYEQIILFSGALTLLVMLRYVRGQGKKRVRWGFFMFANAAVCFAVTRLMPAGVYASRTELFLPWQEGYYENCFICAGSQIVQVFKGGTFATLGKGFVRGFKLLVAEPNMFYVLAVLALCSLLFVIVRTSRRESIHFFAELFSGLFLAVVPLALFFVLKTPWFGLRNAVPSFCGLALMADALFDLIFGRTRLGRPTEAVIVAALALVCCIASVSELHDYRETTLADAKISAAAAVALENAGVGESDTVWLLNVDASYVSDGNFYYHEHDYGVTSSDWALTGAVRAYAENGRLPYIEPVSVYRDFTDGADDIKKARIFLYTGEKAVPVTAEADGDGVWDVVSPDGEKAGSLTLSDGGLRLNMK